MLIQIIKLGKESAWNNEEDKEKYEGKVFYAKNKDQVKMLDRSYCNKPPVGYLKDVELIIHKDFKNPYFTDKYSFYDVEYKILRM